MLSWIVLAMVAILIIWVISIYNGLINLRNQATASWSQIDVQLQRRYDLIPNLVESVKGYMQHERQTLQGVIEARNKAFQAKEKLQDQGGLSSGSMKEFIQAESALKSQVSQLMLLVENYPQLKANENMMRLQEELTSTENKISFSRQAYNDAVMFYNTSQQQFPAVLLAATFGHKTMDLYQISSQEVRQAPKVSF